MTEQVFHRNEFLRAIVRRISNGGAPLFRQMHLDRELIIGFIGYRGEGKSLTGAITALNDFMIRGVPCFSNMAISYGYHIPEDTALRYGCDKGGDVLYKSEPLDKESIFRLDKKYENALLFLDEINMEYAEARRSQSNTNLFVDRLVQEIRHLHTSCIYTVPHEMWVDPRLRQMTDLFVKCADAALSPTALLHREKPGKVITWMLYPMSRTLRGRTFYEMHQPIGPWRITAEPYWGIMDTTQIQARGVLQYSTKLHGTQQLDLVAEKSAKVLEVQSKWGWLYDAIQAIRNQGIDKIGDRELWQYLRLKERGIGTTSVGRQLSGMGIYWKQVHGGRREYYIDNYDLEQAYQQDEQLVKVT